MSSFLALLAVAMVTAASYATACARWRQRRWAYPPFILGCVWTITLAVYLAREDSLFTLRPYTAFVIVLGVVCFSVGALIPTWAGPRPSEPKVVPHLRQRSGTWMVVLAAGAAPAFVTGMLAIGNSGPTDDLLINVRMAVVSQGATRTEEVGFLFYVLSLATFGAGLHAAGLLKNARRNGTALFAIALLFAFFGTGRTSFLLLFTVVGGTLAISGKIRLATLLVAGGGAFVIMFGAMAFLLKKGISHDVGIGSQFWATFSEYLLGGTAALNDYTAESHHLQWGTNTLRIALAVAQRLGFDVDVPPLVQEFRRVPFETNVYTVFRPYLEDFGVLGVAASQVLFGFVHGLLHRRARAGDRLSYFLYGAMLYPLLMQAFEDQYFALASTWIQAAVLLALTQTSFPRMTWRNRFRRAPQL